jgi:hypothetical protein
MSEKKSGGSGRFFKMLGRKGSSRSSSSGNARVDIPDTVQDTNFSSQPTHQGTSRPHETVQREAHSGAGPSWPWARKGKLSYARKSVPMPIKETFQIPPNLPERTPTPTEDEEEEDEEPEVEEHDSSIQIMEHHPETPPHVILSDTDTWSMTAILNAVMETDTLGEGSVHNEPVGHGKGVAAESSHRKRYSKKDLKKMKRELKKAMEAVSEGGPDQTVPMDLDSDDSPRKGKLKEETSSRKKKGEYERRVDVDPYFPSGDMYSSYHLAQQNAIWQSIRPYSNPYHSSPPTAFSPAGIYSPPTAYSPPAAMPPPGMYMPQPMYQPPPSYAPMYSQPPMYQPPQMPYQGYPSPPGYMPQPYQYYPSPPYSPYSTSRRHSFDAGPSGPSHHGEPPRHSESRFRYGGEGSSRHRRED